MYLHQSVHTRLVNSIVCEKVIQNMFVDKVLTLLTYILCLRNNASDNGSENADFFWKVTIKDISLKKYVVMRPFWTLFFTKNHRNYKIAAAVATALTTWATLRINLSLLKTFMSKKKSQKSATNARLLGEVAANCLPCM